MRSAGAILLHSVPATTSTSDCRGVGRKTTPKRSRPQREAPACIISTAQHAKPKVIGHNEPVRVQLINRSAVVVIKPCFNIPSTSIVLLPRLKTALYPIKTASFTNVRKTENQLK